MNLESEFMQNQSERGSAGAKLLVVVIVLFLIGNAGINYVPVAYKAEELKQEMQVATIQGMAVLPGQRPVDLVKEKIIKVVASSGAPADAFVEVKEVNQVVQTTVRYTIKVNILPFGIYQYDYVFDHTATPSGLLFK